MNRPLSLASETGLRPPEQRVAAVEDFLADLAGVPADRPVAIMMVRGV